MSEFGKRGVRSAAASPSRQQVSRASPAPDRDPTVSGLLSRRDLSHIDKGVVPTWVNMSRSHLMGFIVVVPLLVLAGLGYYGPDVVRDIRYAGTFAEADDLRATDGTCKRYMFLVTLCSASIRAVRGGQVTHQPSFLMFFRGGGGAELVPVRSKIDASVVSIEYAVRDVLLNRTLSLLGGTAFFAWIWWLFVERVRKGRYKDGPAHEAVLRYVATKSMPA